MKKQLVFLSLASCVSLVSQGQMIDAARVPQTVKKTFEKRYPGITPQWEYEEGKFDAEYKQDGKKIEILFDRQGNSAQKITKSEAPAEMINCLSAQYKNDKVKKIKKLVAVNNDISYLAILKNKSLLFDSKGKFLSEKKED